MRGSLALPTDKERDLMKYRKGYIYRHGAGFSLCWVVNGKRFIRALRYTEEGEKKGLPITNRREAEAARAKIMAPYSIGSEIEVLEHAAAKLATRKEDLRQVEDRAPALAVADAWGSYILAGNRHVIGERTLANYESYWKSFMAWLSENEKATKELRAINFSIAEAYMGNLLARQVTGRTINAHRSFLRAFWNVLGERARITDNPWRKIAKRDEHSLGRRALSIEELRSVCRTAQGELRLLLALGLYLGARLGDAAMMGWECVDMKRREIAYVPRKTAGKVGRVLRIPMHPELYNILNETPGSRRKGPICPEMAERYASRGADGVSNFVQKHFVSCGLVTSEDRAGAGVRRRVAVGFHSLRHATVSLLRSAGVAQSVSMEIAGHSDTTVHQLYTHVDGDAMRRAIGALPRMKEEPPNPTREESYRLGRLISNVKKMSPKRLKRGVLRFLQARELRVNKRQP